MAEEGAEVVIALDARGAVTACNDAARSTFGLKPGDRLAERLELRLPGNDPEDSSDPILAKALRGEASQAEVVIRGHPQKGVFQLRAVPFSGVAGQVTLVSLRPVPQALHDEGFLASVVEHVAHPIFVKDRQFRFVLLNRALGKLVGRSPEEMIGKTDFDFFPREQAEFFRKKDVEMFETGKEVMIDEEPITDAHGNLHVLSTTKVPLRDASGEPKYLVGIIHDITRLKKAEHEARQLARAQAARAEAERSQRQMALLAEVTRQLASSLSVSRTLEMAARGAIPELADWCLVTLAPGDGEVGEKVLVHADPATEQKLNEVFRTSELISRLGACRVIRSRIPELVAEVSPDLAKAVVNGMPRPDATRSLMALRSYLCVPLVAREHVVGAMVFVSSRPELRYGQEQLAVAQQLADRVAVALDNASLFAQSQEAVRARDEFLSIAAHELRTPLTSLKLNAGALLRIPEGPDGEKLRRAADSMRRQVERLTQMITNLLDVARLTSGRFTLALSEVDLSALAKELVDRCCSEMPAGTCSLRLHAKGPLFGRWDPLRLEEVLSNLVSNALKYAGSGPIDLTLEETPGGVKVQVRDRGPGIAEKDQARIFERFDRGAQVHHHAGGLGLGLYISRQIARAHGGDIRVRSRPGGGACFTVELPRSPPPQAAE